MIAREIAFSTVFFLPLASHSWSWRRLRAMTFGAGHSTPTSLRFPAWEATIRITRPPQAVCSGEGASPVSKADRLRPPLLIQRKRPSWWTTITTTTMKRRRNLRRRSRPPSTAETTSPPFSTGDRKGKLSRTSTSCQVNLQTILQPREAQLETVWRRRPAIRSQTERLPVEAGSRRGGGRQEAGLQLQLRRRRVQRRLQGGRLQQAGRRRSAQTRIRIG